MTKTIYVTLGNISQTYFQIGSIAGCLHSAKTDRNQIKAEASIFGRRIKMRDSSTFSNCHSILFTRLGFFFFLRCYAIFKAAAEHRSIHLLIFPANLFYLVRLKKKKDSSWFENENKTWQIFLEIHFYQRMDSIIDLSNFSCSNCRVLLPHTANRLVFFSQTDSTSQYLALHFQKVWFQTQTHTDWRRTVLP